MILGGYMQMRDINLFWPIYRKIEKEVLEIATYVHIDDTQLKVYSIHIGELIVRCVTEIEAISKRLYEILGGNMNPIDDDGRTRSLYFDTDCLALIENRWKLSTKEIVIENEYFYIENEENKKLIPLKKAHIRSGASWNKAYQAIKHNRFYNLNKAITQLKNHMEYINRNYSSFRTQIHEDKDKAINEEYSGNYLVGPRKTLLVDPQKDIDVKYIAIGGVEREDKSIEESHEIVKCKPADNLEIASWNSFVRKLDEYHGHHPVQ